MAIKGKLRLAIAKERAPNFEALKQQRKLKAAVKRKRSRVEQAALHTLPDNKRPINFPTTEEADGDRDCSDEGSEGVSSPYQCALRPLLFFSLCGCANFYLFLEQDRKSLQINLDNVNDSDTSESSMELESKAIEAAEKGRDPLTAVSHAEGEEADDINDIPVSELEDLDDDIKEDLIPHTRLTINNTSAIQAALDRISMPTDGSVSFASHQSIVSPTNTADSIPDVCDDLQRELAFYSQCLDAARQGRLRLLDEQIPFSRPKDYFAEMVKEDAHMEKVKAKLVEEASTKKAIAEARKLRDLKKFGKQVQVAKLQERQKAKRETLEKIKTLKRSEFSSHDIKSRSPPFEMSKQVCYHRLPG